MGVNDASENENKTTISIDKMDKLSMMRSVSVQRTQAYGE